MGKLQQFEISGQQQQHYLTTCSTMPAMPKEKTSAVSLSETIFTELKLKEQLATSAAAVAVTAAAAMATSAATASTPNAFQTANNRLQHQQQQQQIRNVCGCGATSADVVDGSYNNRNYLLANGHSSPLAAAVASTDGAASQSPQRITSCCRTKQQTPELSCKAGQESASTSTHKMTSYTTSVTPPKKSAKDFIFGRNIGEGSFSTVYLAVDVQTRREYAIKVCEKLHILRENKEKYIIREREVMEIMTNVPGFVNLSCTFQDNRSLYFVMTYAKNGDLLPYVNKVGSFDVDCTRHYAAELVLSCEQMHRRNIVHRDLKPENILLDENMHTLIADFGSAKILSQNGPTSYSANKTSRYYDEEEDEGTNDTNSDDVDSPSRTHRRQRYHRKRKGSFVGTAQYVSPEVLQNGPITPAADLWALGCIIYQMISGLPPFRGSNDYFIFKEILACDLEFPQGFDENAEDLVRKLLKIDPEQRLGASDFEIPQGIDENAEDLVRQLLKIDPEQRLGEQENGKCYKSIRSHPFFAGVNFDTIRQQMPPPIYPYLPGMSKDEDFRSHYRVPENLEPGLDDKQLTRLLGMELGTAMGSDTLVVTQNGVEIEQKTVKKNAFDLSETEKQQRLEQQKSDKWHGFADNEVILKKGYVNKRKGLFARKRMLLLTTGPRLIYIDPVQMIKKGEIPWSPELRVEAKNFKIFFVHTPNRTYYLDDPEGYSPDWVNAIENMRKLTYQNQSSAPDAVQQTTISKFASKTSST